MIELWKEVRPGLEVSSMGRMRKYTDGHLDGDGYSCAPQGKRGARREKVHALVAEAFIGPRPEGHVVRHLNDDRLDNRVENLAYGTRADNAADAKRNGRVPDREAQMAHIRRIAPLGGRWWAGKKRKGLRGAAVRS